MNKTCSRCGKTKNRTEFYKSPGKSTGIRPECKQCSRKENHKRRRSRRAYVNKYKIDKGCTDCGYNAHPSALQFDHVTGEKLDTVSSMVSKRRPWEELLLEIEKCVVRCANCHAIKTSEQLGYFTETEWKKNVKLH